MLHPVRRFTGFAAVGALIVICAGAGLAQSGSTLSPAQPRLNKVLDLLQQGKPAFGIFNGNFGVRTAMALSRSNLDYVLVDMEHGPLNVEQLQIFLMGMTDKQAILRKGNLQPDVVPFVRIPQYGRENLMFIVKQVLDVGVFGIMFPHIDTADQARMAVQSSRYPQKTGAPDMEPPGLRGNAPTNAVWYWGMPGRDYVDRADAWPLDPRGELLLSFQIESMEAVDNIDSILAVPGVGVIFIGPNDLSYHLGNSGNADTPEEEAAIQKVLQACLRKKVPAGITAYNPELATRRLKEGFRFIAIGQEVGLTPAIDATLKAGRAFEKR